MDFKGMKKCFSASGEVISERKEKKITKPIQFLQAAKHPPCLVVITNTFKKVHGYKGYISSTQIEIRTWEPANFEWLRLLIYFSSAAPAPRGQKKRLRLLTIGLVWQNILFPAN